MAISTAPKAIGSDPVGLARWDDSADTPLPVAPGRLGVTPGSHLSRPGLAGADVDLIVEYVDRARARSQDGNRRGREFPGIQGRFILEGA